MAYTTINKPSDYFNTKLYTGNGSTNAITGVGFQPDWLWFKNRADTYNHHVFDAIRGVNQQLQVDSNGAESTYATSMTSFDSDGFTLGANNNINYNGNNHVAWCWKAGGSGSANTDGSINTTSTSVNTTAGFSISKYTGTGSNATVGHGLGSAPKMVIIKSLSAVGDWLVGHSGIGFTERILLNTTAAKVTDSTSWQNTAPTSSVFSIGTNGACNTSSTTYIAYCFADKTGFSKFGSYYGTGSGNNFIYTGFKPAWLMVKKSSGTDAWVMVDSKRDTDNPVSNYLLANSSAAEASGLTYDFVSNGFKFNDSSQNTSAEQYIYMCFAEEPLVGSNNIPATAR